MLFPTYSQSSPTVSTAYIIDYYARCAAERISQHQKEIRLAAQRIDRKAKINLQRAYGKLRNVKRKPLKSVWGQADAVSIDISSYDMTENYVIGTLIHEALHDIFLHGNGHSFTEEEDHRVMHILGEV